MDWILLFDWLLMGASLRGELKAREIFLARKWPVRITQFDR